MNRPNLNLISVSSLYRHLHILSGLAEITKSAFILSVVCFHCKLKALASVQSGQGDGLGLSL